MENAFSSITQDNPIYTTNQAIFIYHLRQNPHGHRQIYHVLDDGRGGMCALGVGMEAFGIIRTWEDYKKAFPDSEIFMFGSPSYYDPYDEIASKLGIPKEHVNEIFILNDEDMMTFGEIADVFEAYLKTDKSFGPRRLLRQSKFFEEKKRFVESWEDAFTPIRVLIEEKDNLQGQLDEAEDALIQAEDDAKSTLQDKFDIYFHWYDDTNELANLDPEDAWVRFSNLEEVD